MSSHLFFRLPLSLFPFTVPCSIVFAKPDTLKHGQTILVSVFNQGQAFIIFANGCLDFSVNLLIDHTVLVRNVQSSPEKSHLKACVNFSNSAVKVHDSQANKNMEMTWERDSFTFDPRDILLSLQMGFSFVRAAVVCAILERISGLKPLSKTTVTRYLFKYPASAFYLYLSLDAIGTFCH